MKSKSLNILLVSFFLIGIMSVMLITFLGQAHEDFPKNITINADETTESVYAIRNLRLTPAQQEKYVVNLVCAASGRYHIYLEYDETDDGGMKEYVIVTVQSGEQTVYQGPLTTLLDGYEVAFDGELKSDDPLPVTICYEMPYTVGNEAMGTYVDFDVCIQIEKS